MYLIFMGGRLDFILGNVMPENNEQEKHNNSANPVESSPKKGGIQNSVVVFIWCMFASILITGWRKFFVGFGIAPIDAITSLFGLSLVPFFLGWIIAKGLGFCTKKFPFKNLWLIGSTAVIVLMLIGLYRGTTGI